MINIEIELQPTYNKESLAIYLLELWIIIFKASLHKSVWTKIDSFPWVTNLFGLFVVFIALFSG